MEWTSNKHHRQEESGKELGGLVRGILFFAACLVVIWAATGCAGTIEKSEQLCAGLDGSWEYTRAEGVQKFSCARGALTRASR